MGFRACTMLWTMALCATVVMTATQGCIYDPDGACGPNQVKGYLGYCECDTGYEQVNLPGGVNFECRNLPEATDGGMVGDASVDAGMPSDISDIQGCSVMDNGNGTATLVCDDGSQATFTASDIQEAGRGGASCDPGGPGCSGDSPRCQPTFPDPNVGYCTSVGCTEDVQCPDGGYCVNDPTGSYCARAATGVGEPCADPMHSECGGLGYDASYCEFVLQSVCMIGNCNLEVNDCPPGLECRDVTALLASVTLPPGTMIPDTACLEVP